MLAGTTIDGMLVGGAAFNCQELEQGDVVTQVYKSLCALNTSTPQNRCTFLSSSCS